MSLRGTNNMREPITVTKPQHSHRAFRYSGNNLEDLIAFNKSGMRKHLDLFGVEPHLRFFPDDVMCVDVTEPDAFTASPGTWLVEDLENGVYVLCTDDQFINNYDIVEPS